MCVLGCGFRLRPAIPDTGVGVAVFLCSPRLYPTNPGWGVWVGVSVCSLILYPAILGWGVRCGFVCLCSGFGYAPPLLAGASGCVCLCAPSACTLPVRAGLCGVGVCAWVRTLAARRLSWLGLCVFVCTLCLYLASPGWVSWCVCECSGIDFHHMNPGSGDWACVFVCPLRLYPAIPGWGVRRGRVCLGSGFGYIPPVLVGALSCVCLCARSACTPPVLDGVCGVGGCALVRVSAALRHSWLGLWGVFLCVRAPPVRRQSWLRFVVPVRGLGLRQSPRQSWMGCWGVCVFMPAPPVPHQSWLGWAMWVCVLGCRFRLRPAIPGWVVGVCVFVCALHLYPASPGWGLWCLGWVLPGTCSRAGGHCVLRALPGLAAPSGLVPWHMSVCLGCGQPCATLACVMAPPGA